MNEETPEKTVTITKVQNGYIVSVTKDNGHEWPRVTQYIALDLGEVREILVDTLA